MSAIHGRDATSTAAPSASVQRDRSPCCWCVRLPPTRSCRSRATGQTRCNRIRRSRAPTLLPSCRPTRWTRRRRSTARRHASAGGTVLGQNPYPYCCDSRRRDSPTMSPVHPTAIGRRHWALCASSWTPSSASSSASPRLCVNLIPRFRSPTGRGGAKTLSKTRRTGKRVTHRGKISSPSFQPHARSATCFLKPHPPSYR